MNSFLIPILSSLLVLFCGLVISRMTIDIGYTFFILSIILFIIIGVAVYLGEVYRVNRTTLGDITLQTIKTLITAEKNQIGTSTTFINSLDDLMELEHKSKEIWIYAYDLAWELNNTELSEAVFQNAKKGVKYKYIIPNEPRTIERVKTLTERYKKKGLANNSILYKKRIEDLKLIRFGVIIYNPTIAGANIQGTEDCTVVFFPRFTEYKDENDDIFLCLKGSQTISFQEDFNSMWNGSTKELND